MASDTNMTNGSVVDSQVPQWRPNRPFNILLRRPIEEQLAMGILFGTVTVLSIVGNLIVLYSYATTKALRTYANYFIFGLALVDLLDGSFVLPMFSAYAINGIWPFSIQLCKAYKFSAHVITLTSYLFTLVICIDRYQALSQPFKHLRLRSKLRAFSAMSISLAIAVLSWIGPIIVWPLVDKNLRNPYISGTLLCAPQYTKNKAFSLVSTVYTAWLPFLSICGISLRIHSILQQRSASVQEHSSDGKTRKGMHTLSGTIEKRSQRISRYDDDVDENAGNKETMESGIDNLGLKLEEVEEVLGSTADIRKAHIPNPMRSQETDATEGMKAQHKIIQQNIKATRVLSLIVAVMVVTRLPWSILAIAQIICKPDCYSVIPVNAYQWLFVLHHMTGTLNPFCYAAGNPLFRAAFIKVLCCRWWCTGTKGTSDSQKYQGSSTLTYSQNM